MKPSNAACTEILPAEQMPSLLCSCQNYAEKKNSMNLLCGAGASDGQVHLIQKDLQSIKSQTFRLVHPSMTLDSRAPELGRILLRLCLRFWCFGLCRLLYLCFLLIQNKNLSLSTLYTFFPPDPYLPLYCDVALTLRSLRGHSPVCVASQSFDTPQRSLCRIKSTFSVV